MSDADPGDPGRAEEQDGPAEAQESAAAGAGSETRPADRLMRGAMAQAVRAGASGERVTASGLLSALGGWLGIVETVLPALLFVVIYVVSRDARLSALVPGGLALVMVVIRLVRRQTLVAALSGLLGVGIAVLITLITGRGVDYFLSGFITNAVWAVGLTASILFGWPALGIVIGALRGELKSWRRDVRIRRTATLLTLLWLGLFVARLAVQIPLYLDDRVEALGIARIAMGIPLFAVVIVVTWFTVRRLLPSSDASSDDSDRRTLENTGEDTPAA